MPTEVLKNGCPSCGSRDWEYDTSKFALIHIEADDQLDLENGFIVLIVSCKVCGLMFLFNPKTTGDLRKWRPL